MVWGTDSQSTSFCHGFVLVYTPLPYTPSILGILAKQCLRLFGLDLCLFRLFKFVQKGEVGLRRWRVQAFAAGVVVISAIGETFNPI